jgi:VanZ family protein
MSRLKQPAAKWRHKVFVSYVILMVIAFLLPTPTTPLAESKHLDKLVQFGIFAGFALLFWKDQQRNPWWTLLISAAFAGGIELVQWLLPYREGDWMDFAAGVAGAGLATILMLWVEHQTGRLAAASVQSSGDLTP